MARQLSRLFVSFALEFEGKPLLVRFTWSHITATSAHWEQAFSTDNGRTWETNWVMDLRRAG